MGNEADDAHDWTLGAWRAALKSPLAPSAEGRRDDRDMLAAGMALLSDAQIERNLEGSQWRREGETIVRDLQLADFAAAIELVNGVAAAAEVANHHPDILVHGWNKLRLTLSTHSEGGLTEADFALAGRLDTLF
jgi:4a-hydroxytetrahydrobiopterin dehydratase